MERGIFATVEHRKLMELKNSGAVDADLLEMLAQSKFRKVKSAIVAERKSNEKDRSAFMKFLTLTLPIEKEVDLMFTSRQELVDHLGVVAVPTRLCPISNEVKEELLFLDRAALYAREVWDVLDMFRRHHEVIVDPDRSVVIEWILQNANKVRNEISKGVDNE